MIIHLFFKCPFFRNPSLKIKYYNSPLFLFNTHNLNRKRRKKSKNSQVRFSFSPNFKTRVTIFFNRVNPKSMLKVYTSKQLATKSFYNCSIINIVLSSQCCIKYLINLENVQDIPFNASGIFCYTVIFV